MDARETRTAAPELPRRLRRSERTRLEALDHCVRLEALGARVAVGGAVAVRDSRTQGSGHRHRLWLDDGSVLVLRLFWPRQCVVAAVVHVRFDDDIGWLVDVRTTSGDVVRLSAWYARCHPEDAPLQ